MTNLATKIAGLAAEIANDDTTETRRHEIKRALESAMITISDQTPERADNISGEIKPSPEQKSRGWLVDITAQACWKAVHGNVTTPTNEPQPFTARADRKYWGDAMAALSAKAEEQGWSDLLDGNDAYQYARSQYNYFTVRELHAQIELENALDDYKAVFGKAFVYAPYQAKERKRTGDADRAALAQTKAKEAEIISALAI